jgi:DNA-binding XRE family transcriptional regulator
MSRKLNAFTEFEERILADPERRAEYEAGLNMLRFGVACCMRREELGLKQKDMPRFGIPAETMCRIEKGDRFPDPKTTPKLAAALQARIVVEPSGEWKLEPVPAFDKAA